MKVWLLVLFLHTPDMPSIKYQAHLYKSEWDCSMAKEEYMTHYYSESESYRKNLKTNAYCLEFDSFPIAYFSQIHEI